MDHAQSRHGLLAAAPQPRRDERHGVRPLPQRRDLFQLADGQPPGSGLHLQRPLFAGQGHQLDRRDHPHGSLSELQPLGVGPLEDQQLFRVAGLQRHPGHRRRQRIPAHDGPRQRVARLHQMVHGGRQFVALLPRRSQQQSQYRRFVGVERRDLSGPRAASRGHLQPLLRLGTDDQQPALHDRPERKHAGTLRLDQHTVRGHQTRRGAENQQQIHLLPLPAPRLPLLSEHASRQERGRRRRGLPRRVRHAHALDRKHRDLRPHLQDGPLFRRDGRFHGFEIAPQRLRPQRQGADRR